MNGAFTINNFQAVSGKNEPAPVTMAFAISLTLLFFILMVESFDRSITTPNQPVSRVDDEGALSHFENAVENVRQPHAVEQVSRRWRGGHAHGSANAKI